MEAALAADATIVGGDAVERPIADEVADVGRDPLVTGFDEPVVVELRDVVLDDVDLLGDDL